jgi:regulator of protease activity HflC (stomatin/prohibitin superfamily)
MDAALGWIGALVQWFAAWVPRIVHVDVREAGVRFVRGKPAQLAKPGIRFYWPITTVFVIWPTNLQVLRLRSQSLRTKDHVLVELELVVAYVVVDVVQVLMDKQHQVQH